MGPKLELVVSFVWWLQAHQCPFSLFSAVDMYADAGLTPLLLQVTCPAGLLIAGRCFQEYLDSPVLLECLLVLLEIWWIGYKSFGGMYGFASHKGI